MEILDFDTTLFKNIFPTYSEFSSWYKTTPLSDDLTDVPSEKTFALIANEFNDSHSAFSPESFKQHFANDLYTYYREFEATTASILELMKLTDDDISLTDTMITNFANVPETTASTSDTEVGFISNQQKSMNQLGKLQIKKAQLANKRAFTVRTFLNRFRHLFIKVISPAYTYVVSEPDEE